MAAAGTVTERIELDYQPRQQFLSYHQRTERFSVIPAHRRAGKTVAHIVDLIIRAATNTQREPRYAYVAPLFNQAKDIAWTYLKRYARPLLADKPNESELKVTLQNSATIRLYGADNPDRLRGGYLDGVVLDEFPFMRTSIWGGIVRPMLADRMGWASFIGSVNGKNEFYRMWKDAENNREWFRTMLKASETGILPNSELEAAKADMGPDLYAQEFECSWDAAISGAFYKDELGRMHQEKRVTPLPIDRAVPVHTAWDLGVTDSTAIWFVQCVGKERRLIDYYESSGVGLDHYAEVLRKKGYIYGKHFFPHDIEAREMSTGLSRVNTLQGLSIDPEVVPVSDVLDGINSVRRMLDATWIDPERCERGLEALKQYRREWDDKLKDWRSRPRHDWCSHGADALRTFAMGYEEPIRKRAMRTPFGFGFRRGNSTRWLGA